VGRADRCVLRRASRRGRLGEIRLQPIDLSCTARGADRGVPRLATPAVALNGLIFVSFVLIQR